MQYSKIIADGDLAFDIEGTFQIHNKIYVLTDDADDRLLNHLADLGYKLKDTDDNGYTANLSHKTVGDEIISELINSGGSGTNGSLTFFIDFQYKNQPKLRLENPDLYKILLSAASQRSDLDYYNRPNETISDIAIYRMSGFVKNIVDCPFDKWEDFIDGAQNYHAQDFIREMAYWASINSDNLPREIKKNTSGQTVTLDVDNGFDLTKPVPIFFGSGSRHMTFKLS